VYYVGITVAVYTVGGRWTPQSWTFEGTAGNNDLTHNQFNNMVVSGGGGGAVKPWVKQLRAGV
jgi:hypothetical protein